MDLFGDERGGDEGDKGNGQCDDDGDNSGDIDNDLDGRDNKDGDDGNEDDNDDDGDIGGTGDADGAVHVAMEGHAASVERSCDDAHICNGPDHDHDLGIRNRVLNDATGFHDSDGNTISLKELGVSSCMPTIINCPLQLTKEGTAMPLGISTASSLHWPMERLKTVNPYGSSVMQ